MNYRRSEIEHLRKEELIQIVKRNFELWPSKEPWDSDPMGHKARPTTKTLKKIIMEYFPRPHDETEPDEENHVHDGRDPEPSYQKDSQEGKSGVHVYDDEMQRESESTRKANPEGVSDIGDTTDAKNANDANDTDYANDVNDHNDASDINDIKNLETVITVLRENHVHDGRDPEPSYQKDSQEGKSGVHVYDDEMQRESESTRKVSPEGVSDIGDTTDAKNANDTNDTDHANDANDHNDASDTNDIENLETVITVLRTKAEMDPELSTGFKNCRCSKNKKLSDYETLQNYFFVVNFQNKWYERRVMVKDKEILVRKNHILEVIDRKASWFTQAQQVTELFKRLNNQDEELERLKNSRLGGKALMAHWKQMLGEA